MPIQPARAPALTHAGAQGAFDFALYRTFGAGPFVYLLACLFLAGSLHPTAGMLVPCGRAWLNRTTDWQSRPRAAQVTSSLSTLC